MKFSVIVYKVDHVPMVAHFKTNKDAANACALAMFALTGSYGFQKAWMMQRNCTALEHADSLRTYAVRIERC